MNLSVFVVIHTGPVLETPGGYLHSTSTQDRAWMKQARFLGGKLHKGIMLGGLPPLV